MESGQIKADLSALGEGEEAFAQVLGAFTEVLAELDKSLGSHLREWDGAAASAYWDFHHEWRDSAAEMAVRLQGLRDVIGRAHGNYGTSLSTNVRMWQPR